MSASARIGSVVGASLVEVNLDGLAIRIVFEAIELAGRESERACDKRGWHGLLLGVERLHDRVVIAARGGNLVFGVSQLCLEVDE